MNLFFQPLIPQGFHYLDPEESKHCVRVLRRSNGDSILITDGKGFFYNAIITKADAHQCNFDILEKTHEPKRNCFIHIAISPTKNTDRLEWFVEKAVEIGVDKISFIDCKNTERSHLKLERLEKVAISAMKQSLKASVPDMHGLTKLNDFLKRSINEHSKFIAYVDNDNPNHLKDLIKPDFSHLVLIGPEGDFSLQELALASESGFKKVSLGTSRLRTETAGVVACHILNLFC